MVKNNWIPYPRFQMRKNLIEEYIKKNKIKGKYLLEIGYGSGYMLPIFSKYFKKVLGFDFSPQAYKLATEINSNNRNITILKNEIDINKNKYDCIVALEVLEHIKDDTKELGKWSKLLNKHGYLIISVPAKTIKWSESDIAVGHYRRYEKIGLNILVSKYFHIKTIYSYGFPFNIVLDKLSNEIWKRNNANKNKIQASKLSGIFRKNGWLLRLITNSIFILPFTYIQKIFLRFDLGSNYLLIARKK